MTKLNWDRVRRDHIARPAPKPMGLNAGRFQSKYRGTCGICGAKFPPGTPCAFTLVGGKRKIVHGACL